MSDPLENMMDAIANVLEGGLRYRLFRYSTDRHYYESAASIPALRRTIRFALDDHCDGYVLDTRKGVKISLPDAEAIAVRVMKELGF